MKRFSLVYGSVAFVLLALALPSCSPAPAATPEGVELDEAPDFRVDPGWPHAFQENWILGAVTGIGVDSRGHVWVTHAPGLATTSALGAAQDPPVSTCCVPAPSVLEFGPEGELVQSWEMEGREDLTWPEVPHGLFVDHDDNVWIGSREPHQLFKFDREGGLLLTIGEEGVTQGSDAPDHLGRPSDVWVDPETNEAFVADGYGNRRIVVYDGDTGEYLRHWGAYGDPPDDEYEHPDRGPDAEPSRQFGTVHGITGSRDGLIYVADRRNNRIQVFQQDGTFVDEVLVAAETLGSGTAFDVALSADPEEEFLYLTDGTNHKIWILRRADLEVLTHFGRGGYQIGEFVRPHNMATDGDGNIYVSEAASQRVQRFRMDGAPATQ